MAFTQPDFAGKVGAYTTEAVVASMQGAVS